MTARLVQKNILATIETLSMCTPGKNMGLLREGEGKVCYSWVSLCVHACPCSSPAVLQAECADGPETVLLCLEDAGATGAHLLTSRQRLHLL